METNTNAAVELIRNIIYDGRNQAMCWNPERMRLSIPSFLLPHFINGLRDVYLHSAPIDWSEGFTFEGVKFIPAYEMAITLFHVDYLLSLDDSLIIRIPLMPPHKITSGSIQKYLVLLQSVFVDAIRCGDDSSN